jgi:hypothetical protein
MEWWTLMLLLIFCQMALTQLCRTAIEITKMICQRVPCPTNEANGSVGYPPSYQQ